MHEMITIRDAWYNIGEGLEEWGEECDYLSADVRKQEYIIWMGGVGGIPRTALREKQVSHHGGNMRVLLEAISKFQHLLSPAYGNRAEKQRRRKRVKVFRYEAERKGSLGIGVSQVEDGEQNFGGEWGKWCNVFEGSVQRKREFPINVHGA